MSSTRLWGIPCDWCDLITKNKQGFWKMVYLERAHMYDNRNHSYKCGQAGKLFQSSISRRSIRFRFNRRKIVISQDCLQLYCFELPEILCLCAEDFENEKEYWLLTKHHPDLHLSGNPLTIASSTWAHMKSWWHEMHFAVSPVAKADPNLIAAPSL